MRYLKLFESFEDIHDICKKYHIKEYTINSDGTIDVDGNLNLSYRELTKLPLRFNKINGYFNCSYNTIGVVEGSPIEVNGDCSFYGNKLTSFKGSPKIIRGNFDCRWNKINSFEYFPSYVRDDFYCDYNPIYEVWRLFTDTTKIELLNDCDIFRDEDTDKPVIVMDRLNDFLLTIGKPEVEKVNKYKNI